MAFIIIDLEFNNLSGIHKCFPDIYNKIPNLKELDLVNEIIEIGAIKVDKYMQPIDKMKVYIKPSVIPVLNPNILDITGIKEENLKNGLSFIEGIEKLKEMVDEGDIICSWAKDDIVEIIRNANHYNYRDISWIDQYLDLQEYTTKILGFKKSLSLSNALKYLKIKFEGDKLHDALNDAVYEFNVFKHLYNTRAVKKYIVNNIYEMPALEVDALSTHEIDYDNVKQLCPRCNKKIESEYPFKLMGWRFVSIGICNKCNNKILNELIVKRSLDGKIIYQEVLSFINEIEYSRYENRLKDKH